MLARDMQRHLDATHPGGYQLKRMCLPVKPTLPAPVPLAHGAKTAVTSLYTVKLTAFPSRHSSNGDVFKEVAKHKQRTLAGQVVEEDEEDLDLPDIGHIIPQPPVCVEVHISKKRAYAANSYSQPHHR